MNMGTKFLMGQLFVPALIAGDGPAWPAEMAVCLGAHGLDTAPMVSLFVFEYTAELLGLFTVVPKHSLRRAFPLPRRSIRP